MTWSSAFQTFLDNPINGRGIGLDAGNVNYLSPEGAQSLGDAHELWLSVAAQQGAIGLMAILLITGWFLLIAVRRRRGKLIAFGSAYSGGNCFRQCVCLSGAYRFF